MSTPMQELPQVGDKYHRDGMTVEVTDHGPQTVTCKFQTKLGPDFFTVSLEEFHRLERKSLEFGAVFEPASTSTEARP